MGVIRATHLVAPIMQSQEGGANINISTGRDPFGRDLPHAKA
jgi:hypothetical protein